MLKSVSLSETFIQQRRQLNACLIFFYTQLSSDEICFLYIFSFPFSPFSFVNRNFPHCFLRSNNGNIFSLLFFPSSLSVSSSTLQPVDTPSHTTTSSSCHSIEIIVNMWKYSQCKKHGFNSRVAENKRRETAKLSLIHLLEPFRLRANGAIEKAENKPHNENRIKSGFDFRFHSYPLCVWIARERRMMTSWVITVSVRKTIFSIFQRWHIKKAPSSSSHKIELFILAVSLVEYHSHL